MVNTEKFILRLKKIIEENELSSSGFAEQLGVQRATISHLLSGRNKPSLDFILKVIEAFPEVDLYWLLNGKGQYNNTTPTPAPLTQNQAPNLFSEKTVAPNTEETKNLNNDSITEDAKQENHTAASFLHSDVAKVIICYRNGTFEVFKND